MNVPGSFEQMGKSLGKDFATSSDSDDIECVARMEFRSDAIGQLIHQASHVGLVVIIPHRGEGY